MKFGLRTSVAVAMVFAISLFVSAQTPAQVGDVYVGTCDGALQNTQQNEIDVYNSTGQFVTAIHGPTQNSCMAGMTFVTAILATPKTPHLIFFVMSLFSTIRSSQWGTLIAIDLSHAE